MHHPYSIQMPWRHAVWKIQLIQPSQCLQQLHLTGEMPALTHHIMSEQIFVGKYKQGHSGSWPTANHQYWSKAANKLSVNSDLPCIGQDTQIPTWGSLPDGSEHAMSFSFSWEKNTQHLYLQQSNESTSGSWGVEKIRNLCGCTVTKQPLKGQVLKYSSTQLPLLVLKHGSSFTRGSIIRIEGLH